MVMVTASQKVALQVGDLDKASYELIYFWEHLTKAGFAEGTYDGESTNGKIR